MPLSDWFRGGSALERALKRGMQPGADLVDELRELGDVEVKSAREAQAICDGLEQVHRGTLQSKRSFSTSLHALAALFQGVQDPECEALPLLRERGIPLLYAIFDRGFANEKTHSSSDLLFVLKILANYGTQEGTARVLSAARAAYKADDYMWSVILRAYAHDHPHTASLFLALRDPLPPSFIGVSLVDAANAACSADAALEHPFDTSAGATRLRQWLADVEVDRFSYAVSATAALPFLRRVSIDALLELASVHPHTPVRLESASAEARLQRPSGIARLARFALDVNHSNVARRYLEELGASDVVPAEALTPGFQARAEFAEWLAHPSELGRPPDEVEIVDHRVLRWPPEFAPKPFWLLRYRVNRDNGLDDDDCDVGMVGSTTFCLFTYNLNQRPPEDGYAIHCAWEMEAAGLLKVEESEEGVKGYDALLGTWRGAALSEAQIVAVAEIDLKLRVRPGLLGVAAAKRDGRLGWAVVGDDSGHFYAADELPDAVPGLVLKIEIGRRILGFTDRPNRREWLKPKRQRTPAEVVEAFERQLAGFRAGTPQEQLERIKAGGFLRAHFSAYIDSLVAVRGGERAQHVVALYEEIWNAAKAAHPEGTSEVFDSFNFLSDEFDAYVDALISLGRRDTVLRVVEFYAQHWQHNLGWGRLGRAAFRAGAHPIAEPFFLKLRAEMEHWFRCEEMSMLARIWHHRGEGQQASRLIIDALKAVIAGANDADSDDRKIHEEAFQRLRQTMSELFPLDGAAMLTRENIPQSIFQ